MSIGSTRTVAAVSLLKTLGRYRERPAPLHIAHVDYEFKFDAILEGPNDEKSLVVVCAIDTLLPTPLERRLLSLSHALRRTGSTRPLTLVLLCTNADRGRYLNLSECCRLIVVADADELETALASLLPLPIPSQAQTLRSAAETLRQALGDTFDHPFTVKLLKAATHKGTAVESALIETLREAATPPAAGDGRTR